MDIKSLRKRKLCIDIFIIVFAIFTIVALSTFAAPCASGMVCKRTIGICKYVLIAVILITIITDVLVLLSKEVRKLIKLNDSIGFVRFIVMVFGAFAPLIFGTCKVKEMACNAYSVPVLWLCLFIMAMAYNIDVILDIKILKEEKSDD